MSDNYQINYVFKATANQAGTSLKKLGSEFEVLRNQVAMTYSRMNVPLNKAGLGSFLGKGGMGKDLASSGLMKAGGMLRSAAGPIAGAFALKSMVDHAVDFEKIMGKIATRVPNDTAKLRSIGTSIKDLSMETGKPIEELGEAMFELVNDFKDASSPELSARLKVGMGLSKVAFGSTAESVDYLSRITSTFGKSTPETMEMVAARTFSAMKKADVSFEEFSSTMNGLAPDAKNLGIGMDELFSIFSTFADGREQFTKLGGGLQLMLRNMVQAGKGTSNLDLAIQGLNYTSGKDLLSKEGFAGAMESLRGQAGRMGLQFEELVGSGRGLFTALKMDAKGMKELRENTKGGTTDLKDFHDTINAVNKVTQTSRSINKMKETAGVTATNLGGIFAPLLTGILNAVNIPLKDLNMRMERTSLIREAATEYEQKYQGNVGKGMGYRQFFNTYEGRTFLLENSSATREAWDYVNQSEGRTQSALEQVLKIQITTDDEGNVNINPKMKKGKATITSGIQNVQ